MTKKRAAQELSISVRKLELMIAAGVIGTCLLDGKKQIPRSEIVRLTRPRFMKGGGGAGRKKNAVKNGREAFDPRSSAEALRKYGRRSNS